MQCYFMIMLSLCTPTNEGSERQEATEGEGERADLTSPAPTWVFYSFFSSLCDTVLLFQPTGSTCRQNGNLYCNNCSKFACPLVKGQRRAARRRRVVMD